MNDIDSNFYRGHLTNETKVRKTKAAENRSYNHSHEKNYGGAHDLGDIHELK